MHVVYVRREASKHENVACGFFFPKDMVCSEIFFFFGPFLLFEERLKDRVIITAWACPQGAANTGAELSIPSALQGALRHPEGDNLTLTH